MILRLSENFQNFSGIPYLGIDTVGQVAKISSYDTQFASRPEPERAMYNVYYAPEGSSPTFLGAVGSIAAAKKAAAHHHRNPGSGLPECLYDTARRAGHCGGASAPEGVEAAEPAAWFGRGGWYCAVAVR